MLNDRYIFEHNVVLCGLFLLAAVMAIALTWVDFVTQRLYPFCLCFNCNCIFSLFLGYHFHLVAAGTTTNETFKWGTTCVSYIFPRFNLSIPLGDLGETYYRLIEGFEKESEKGEVKGFGKVYYKIIWLLLYTYLLYRSMTSQRFCDLP